MIISIETFVKNCKLSLNENRYIDDLALPVNNIKLINYTTFYLHENILPAFQNIHTLKLVSLSVTTQAIADRVIAYVLKLMPSLKNLKIKDMKLAPKKEPKDPKETICDMQSLLAALLDNNQIEKLSLVNLSLGQNIETR